MHLTVGIFGDQELAKRLGKKGTANDIAMFNHGSSEGVFTYVCPNSEKVQPLMQVLNMIDVPVLVANSLTKEIGEMIVGIDEMKFTKGFIVTSMLGQLEPIIKDTSLKNFKILEESELWPELTRLEIERKDEQLLVPIDNYFNVTGVGTIVLGMVKSGTLRKYDKAMLEPLGKEVTVKGIQSQDRDLEQTEPGMRVGLNLKGVDEIKRGYILCKDALKASELKIKFAKNRFSKQELKDGMNVQICVGLQVVTCLIVSAGNELVLKSAQPVAYMKNQACMVASQSESYPRIIGSGLIE